MLIAFDKITHSTEHVAGDRNKDLMMLYSAILIPNTATESTVDSTILREGSEEWRTVWECKLARENNTTRTLYYLQRGRSQGLVQTAVLYSSTRVRTARDECSAVFGIAIAYR